MQVNLSTALPNAAGEATAKAGDTAGEASSSSFFAQMGQILHPDAQSGEANGGGQPEERPAGKSAKDPMQAIAGLSLLSIESIKEALRVPEEGCAEEIPVLQENDENTEIQQNPDRTIIEGNLVEPAFTIKAGQEQRGQSESVASAEILHSHWITDSADAVTQPAAGRSQNIDGEAASEAIKLTIPDIPSPISGGNGGIQSDPANSGNNFPKDLSGAGNAELNAGVEAIRSSAYADLTTDEVVTAESGPIQPVVDVRPAKQIHQPIETEARLDGNAAIGAPQPRLTPETEYLTDKNIVRENSDDGEPHALSNETDSSGRSFSTAATGKRPASVRISASDNADAAESGADRNASSDDLPARPTVQGKSENGQPAVPGKPQPLDAQHKQEFQLPQAANPMRMAEGGSAGAEAGESVSRSRPQDFLAELADQIQIQVRDGKGAIRIQLKPELLGHIEIRAETTVTGITARITAESASVKNYLENNIQFLQQTLSDQGLRIDRIQIVSQDSLDPQSSPGQSAQFGHSGSGRSGRESETSSGAPGSLLEGVPEEISVDPQAWLAMNPNNRFYTVA